MLRNLLIRDIVLIESLDLEFSAGLNVLTGETGAGKSILLDALGFALGRPVRRDLVRAGVAHGSATAVFELPTGHGVWGMLRELDLPAGEGELILRRVASAQGPNRAFVNDQRVSAEVLSRVGAVLVEVHGQHDDRGLLNPRGHGALLDMFAGLAPRLADTRAAWVGWQAAKASLDKARAAQAQALEDEEFLRHSLDELEVLSPTVGEDESLDVRRRLMRQSAELITDVAQAQEALSSRGAEGVLSDALSRLMHVAERAEGRLEATISAVDCTLSELADAQSELDRFAEEMQFNPGELEEVEERLFAIRGLARKHDCVPDALPALAAAMAEKLKEIDAGEGAISELSVAEAAAAEAYVHAAADLSVARRKAAGVLDTAVTGELAPLRMENARFVTELATRPPGPDGTDSVRFTASINPGAPAGPIDKIASGGELSRFLLALKVQLAAQGDDITMIFDEIDRGVGGATADAVGRRLASLSAAGQVLVVTHSPQVAAKGTRHFLISKSAADGSSRTEVVALDATAREDELARMLAGDRVTDAARQAARALLEEAR